MELQEAISQPGQAPTASAAFPCLAQETLATDKKVLICERLQTLRWAPDYGVPHSPGVTPDAGVTPGPGVVSGPGITPDLEVAP